MLSSIFSIIDNILGRFPKRLEGIKNEIDKLEYRQSFISINKRNDLASEYERNARRLQELYKRLKNSTNSS